MPFHLCYFKMIIKTSVSFKIYLFTDVYSGCWLLRACSVSLQQAGAPFSLWGTVFSL